MLIGASHQVEHFNNAIYHHDGCRLVYPAMWDIEQFRFVFMTDATWCIPTCWSFGISIQFKMSRIDQFTYNSINHSHAINCQHFKYHIFKSICTFVITFQRYASSIQSFQIYLVNYQNTRGKDRGSVNKPKLSALVSFPSISILG